MSVPGCRDTGTGMYHHVHTGLECAFSQSVSLLPLMLVSSVSECGILSLEWCVVFLKINDPGDLIHHATQGLSKCFPCCEMRRELGCDFPKAQYPHLFYSESLNVDYDTLTTSPKKQVSFYFFFPFHLLFNKGSISKLKALIACSIFNFLMAYWLRLYLRKYIYPSYVKYIFSVWKVIKKLFIKSAAFKTGNRARVWCINLSGPF